MFQVKQVLRLRQTENKSSKLVKRDSKQIVFINNINFLVQATAMLSFEKKN